MPITSADGTDVASTASRWFLRALQCVDLEVVHGLETVDESHGTRLCIRVHCVPSDIKIMQGAQLREHCLSDVGVERRRDK